MPNSYWRNEAKDVIAEVVIEHGTDDMLALKLALSEAYPFGERKYWPYKVWLEEVNFALTMISRRKRQLVTHENLRNYWLE